MPDGGTKLYGGKEDIQDALLTGVLSRRVVRYAYRDARGRTTRGLLAAFAMVLHKHGLYIIGKRLRRPEDGPQLAAGTRCDTPFAVERFAEAEALRGTSFVPPPDFRLSSVIHPAGGIFLADPEHQVEVVIEFSRDKATYVLAREWFPGQRFDERPDGRIRLSFPAPTPHADRLVGAGMGTACARGRAGRVDRAGRGRAGRRARALLALTAQTRAVA